MSASPTPAYYLIMTGGSLMLTTSVVTWAGAALDQYYQRFFPIFTNPNEVTTAALTLVCGLAVLYPGPTVPRKT